MSVKRYIQIPGSGELVPAEEYHRKHRGPSWQVMPDIQPYVSQIDGSVVHSRSQHRAHLRSHGCIEIGNEKQPIKPISSPPGLKRTIIDVANEKLR